MSAEIHVLPVIRVERDEPEGDILVLRLGPRVAKRLRAAARDCRIAPGEMAALLLEKILFPEDQP